MNVLSEGICLAAQINTRGTEETRGEDGWKENKNGKDRNSSEGRGEANFFFLFAFNLMAAFDL